MVWVVECLRHSTTQTTFHAPLTSNPEYAPGFFIYKIFYGLCDISLSITFAKSSTRGNRLKLVKPSCRCDIRKYFFSCRIVGVSLAF